MTAKPAPKWSPGAWTPKRCAIWNKLEGDARKVLETWVLDEARREVTHQTQLRPEDEALLTNA